MTSIRASSIWRFCSVIILLVAFDAARALQIVEELKPLTGEFNQPSAVALQANGNAAVLDGVNGRVTLFDAAGRYLKTFHNPTTTTLRLPMDLTYSEGAFIVADSGNHRLVIFDEEGAYRREIDLRDSGNEPEPVGIAADDGLVFWSDRRNHRICSVKLYDGEDVSCWGAYGEKPSQFRYPFMIDLDRNGYLYIVDVLNGRIQIFNQRGIRFAAIDRFGVSTDRFLRPNGIVIDGTGLLFVADAYNGTIQVFRDRRYLGVLRDRGGELLMFDRPAGIARWQDRLYVTEMGSNRVRVLRLDNSTVAHTDFELADDRPAVSRKNCVTCHLTWSDDYQEAAVDIPFPPVASARMCLSCHHGAVVDSRETMGSGEQHPEYHTSLDALREAANRKRLEPMAEDLPLVENSFPYCGTCHTPHRPREEEKGLRPRHDNAWMRHSNSSGGLCLACHEHHSNPAPETAVRGLDHHPLRIKLSTPPRQDAKGYTADERLRQGLPERLKERGGRLGDDAGIVCASCHRAHGGLGEGLLLLAGDALCASCHESAVSDSKEQARKKGVHPIGESLETAVEIAGETFESVTCASCHDVHDADSKASLLRSPQPEALCKACHDDQHAESRDEARNKGIHPVDLELEEPVRIGDREVKRLGCLTCHKVHGGKPETPSLIIDHRDGALCKNCHKREGAVLGTHHDLRLTAKESQNRFGERPAHSGLCGSCHTLHRSDTEIPFLFAGELLQHRDDRDPSLLRDALCLSCHQEKGIAEAAAVREYTHPYRDLVMRTDIERMPLLDENGQRSEFGRIGCITCHDPHRWSPESTEEAPRNALGEMPAGPVGTVLNSFLHPDGPWGSFCADCHGPEALVRYKFYHDKRGRPKRADSLR